MSCGFRGLDCEPNRRSVQSEGCVRCARSPVAKVATAYTWLIAPVAYVVPMQAALYSSAAELPSVQHLEAMSNHQNRKQSPCIVILQEEISN